MQIRVPIDDTTTWALFYSTHNSDQAGDYPDQGLTDYEYQWRDANGNHIVDYIEGQDVMAWVSQGPITDRSSEHIGKSDIGIVMLRRMFKEALAAVEAGEDPIGVVREPHDRIDLPCEKDKFGAGAEFPLAWINMGSMRYSPIKDQLERFHEDVAKAAASA
jgi:5,5'-dehydrodivanillate O-demethylase